jgi:hypothetical protein
MPSEEVRYVARQQIKAYQQPVGMCALSHTSILANRDSTILVIVSQ